jgi:3-hydroxyisobutyrate dehydrogenase-like beta-hydroxyacid dehydrogenase
MSGRRIGFVGLGAMGGGMVRSLLRAGFAVTAHDLRAEARAEAVQHGAREAGSPREAAVAADVVCTSLPDPGAVETAVLGPDGLVEGLSPGATHIDLSSIDPATVRKVGVALAARGVRMLDVPVGKGPAAAAAGDLTLMVGGDPEVVDACQDVLHALGSTQFYCGPLGSGATVKLINNLVSCSLVALNAEAMVLGARANVDLDVLVDVLKTTAADNWHLRNTIAPMVLAGAFAPRFRLALAHKDLGLALRMGLALGAPLPLATAAHLVHTLAMGAGLGDEDQAACVKPLERAAGIEARRGSGSATWPASP